MTAKAPKPARGRPARYLTEAEIAELLEVTTPELRRLRAEGCPHQMRSGRVLYRLPQVLAWREERAIKALDADEAKERARKMRADADSAEMRAARLRGELAPVAEMNAAVERLATAVRNEVAGIRSRFTLRIVGLKSPHEAALVLDDMQKQILSGLAEQAAGMADDDELEGAA